MTRQSQSSGNQSTNVQAGGSVTVNHNMGLTPGDAKDIAMALAQPELERLTDKASRIACARVDDFVNQRLIPRIIAAGGERLASFEDPDVQYALLNAQRTYARTGDSDVADVLVDILVERTGETERTVRQLALNEALEVAGKLTSRQFAVLSLIWLLKYTQNPNLNSRQAMTEYFGEFFAPFSDAMNARRADFLHLEYASCGTVSIGSIPIENLFRSNYAGVFSRGFSEDTVNRRFEANRPTRLQEMFVTCLSDSRRIQFSALNEQQLRTMARDCELDASQTEIAVAVFSENLMRHEDVRHELGEMSPSIMQPLLDFWDESEAKHLTLTSVGIAIGHANCRRVIGESPGDLSIWL